MNGVSKKLKFLLQLTRASAVVSRKFSSQGLGFSDLAVLLAIRGAEGEKIRRVDLAEQLGLTASGVTRLLLPLEKIGVVKREANERDARVSYATLTAVGKRLLADSLESAEVRCDDLVASADAKKLDDFSEHLAAVR